MLHGCTKCAQLFRIASSFLAIMLPFASGVAHAQQTRIRVDVDLVNLYVAVTDGAGRPLAGLGKELSSVGRQCPTGDQAFQL